MDLLSAYDAITNQLSKVGSVFLYLKFVPTTSRKQIGDKMEKSNVVAINSPRTKNNNFGLTYKELLRVTIAEREEIICGLGRGEIGLLNASTDVGKTTLLRNVIISLCVGRAFDPLVKAGPPRRVALLDFEDTRSYLRQDLKRMTSTLSSAEQELFANNALIFCDERDAEDRDLSLSDREHLRQITQRLKDFDPDLIGVDTTSKGFRINNENDNSEVIDSVMRPLRRLAQDCNAALIALHHVGKSRSEEGQIREASHKGRGASAFADQSRIVLNLSRDNVDRNSVVLSCAKLKGKKFDNVLLRLDPQVRWFSRQGTRLEPTPYEMLLEIFSDGEEHTTQEVKVELDGLVSERSVKRLLKEGVDRSDLFKVKHGIYKKMPEGEAYKDDTSALTESDKGLDL